MTDGDDELKERLWEKVMERMPPDGTSKDVKRILEDVILGDEEEAEEGEWIH